MVQTGLYKLLSVDQKKNDALYQLRKLYVLDIVHCVYVCVCLLVPPKQTF